MLTTVHLYLCFQGSTRFWLSDQRLKLLDKLFFHGPLATIMQACSDPNPKPTYNCIHINSTERAH